MIHNDILCCMSGRALISLPCAQEKAPPLLAGLVSLRANRAVPADPVALPIHHPETVTYEQF